MNDHTLRLRARLDVDAATAWAALTDPAALRTWLAEHAEVDLPHRYAFWGRSTPDGAEPGQRPVRVGDRSITLRWTLFGTETTVEIGVETGPDGTVVTVAQGGVPSWAEAVADQRGLSVLTTFWGLALGNLVEHLEGRPLTPKPDYTSREQRAEVEVAAGPEEVYRSLVDPEVFRRWFGAHLGIEPRVGGRWAMGGFDVPGEPARIAELEPGRRIALDWPDGMVTTWELEGSAGRTRLTFVQSGFADPPDAGWTGWLGGIVELRRFHEVPGWRPLWIRHELPGIPDGLATVGSG